MKWAVLLGSAAISGGTYVIFEHTIRAKRRGEDITIVTQEPVDPDQLQWHPEARELTWKTFEEVEHEEFDVAIATWWRTLYELHRVPAKAYAYFVQSIESYFYPPEEDALRKLVDATYQVGLPIITEATWIRDHLAEVAALQADLVHNGIRKDIYTLDGPAHAPRQPGKLRVLVEGPLKVPFKNVERTIELCRQSEADEVWLLTSSEVESYPGVDRLFSRVPIFETPAIYRSCDVIVKLSYVEGMFGPPLEMFHCGGTAITYDVTGHDEYLRAGENALVIKRDDEQQVIVGINRLKSDPELLARLKAAGEATAKAWPSWDEASEQFARSVSSIVARGTISREQLKQRSAFMMEFYAIAEKYRNLNNRTWKERLRAKWASIDFQMRAKLRPYKARVKRLLGGPENRQSTATEAVE